MAETTRIEWCDATWNPWIGCTKISPACDHCYAARMNGWLKAGENWGPGAPRLEYSDEHWKKPGRWAAKALREGTRPKVFPSVCDPFDNEVRTELRAKFAFSTLIFQVDSPNRPTLEQQYVDVRAKAVKRARTEIQSATQAFISDCVTRLRQETAKLCEEVLVTVNNTENLSAKTVNRLQTFMTRFESLNFADDVEMAEQIRKFKADLLSAEEYRASPAAMTSLSEGLTKLRSEALKLITSDPKPGLRIGAKAPRALGPANEEEE